MLETLKKAITPDYAEQAAAVTAELAIARAEETAARQAYGAESLDGEPTVATSKALEAASKRVARLLASLEVANDRAAAQRQSAEAAAGDELKAQRRALHAAMVKAAAAADDAIIQCADAIVAAAKAQQAYAAVAAPKVGAVSAMLSTNLAVFEILKHRLRGVPGISSPGVFWNPTEDALWRYSARLPELDAGSK